MKRKNETVHMQVLRMTLAILVLSFTFIGCQSWEWQEPVPEYAIDSCIRAGGNPIYDSIGNELHFRCEFRTNIGGQVYLGPPKDSGSQ